MTQILLLPVIGLAAAYVVNLIWPKASFRGYDVMPFFLIYACQLLTDLKKLPSFLPSAFLLYFILILLSAIKWAMINKNISLSKMFRQFWSYLDACSFFWYLGLLLVTMI
ncbi:DUF3397 domain-containing protein [Lactobacillus sp.]|uniref:DUF3397 domain-containing protein n=1 Tax=Lactobacillus sp. TaxID=1591 RepID=UPI003EF35BA3